MAITSISISQNNSYNGSNLLPVQSELYFLANVNYTGVTPDVCNVEIRDMFNVVLETYRAIPYKDASYGQRTFMFDARTPVRALMGSFDDFTSLSDVLEYVDGITKRLKIRFVSPDNALIYTEVVIDFAHAFRQFGERPNLEAQYNNDSDVFLAEKNKYVYIYFYNGNELNELSTSLAEYMNVQPKVLSFGNVTELTNSVSLPMNVVASGLSGNISVVAPTNFQVSSNNVTFTSSLTLTPSGGAINTTVYARYSPPGAGADSGSIVFSSTGAPTIAVSVSGVGIAVANPVITTSISSYAFGSVTENTNTAAQSVTVTGADLSTDIIINAPTGFGISTDNVLFVSQLTLPQAGGIVNNVIYVRFSPTAIQAYGGSISLSSTGAATQTIALSGSGIAALNPVINLAQTNYDFGNVIINSNSTPTTVLVIGIDLSTDITVTAPTGYQVSTDNINYYSTLAIPSIGTTVYVRFSPTAIQSYNAQLTFSSTGATPKYFALAGAGIANTVPALGVNPNVLVFPSTPVDTSATPKTFAISGSNLTGDIFLLPPTNFTISLDNVTYLQALNIAQVGGLISETVYVRFTPTLVAFYDVLIDISSADLPNIQVTLIGQGT